MIEQCVKPYYSHYSIEINRLKSFESWPKSMTQKPADMAEAGFFYTKQSDRVHCYFCGGGMKDWSPGDIPWEEHARFFQTCPYVLSMMGEEYVSKIVNGETKSTECCETLRSAKNTHIEEPEETINYPNLICKICFENKLNYVFIPCGHAIACTKCALSLNNNICPICRKVYIKSIKIFF